MKGLRFFVLSAVISGMLCSTTFAGKHLPEERGKALFNDPKFAGGIRSCNSCHPNGKGLEEAGKKKEFRVMGKTLRSLEDVVNLCIEMGNKGKPIDVKSSEMADIVAYIKSLAKKPTPAPKKKIEGC